MACPAPETEKNPATASCSPVARNDGLEETQQRQDNGHLRNPLPYFPTSTSPPVLSFPSPSSSGFPSSSLPGSFSSPHIQCSADESLLALPLESGDKALAAACWVYSVSLLSEQPPLPPSSFSSSRQQNAFRWYLTLRPFVNVALCLYLLLAFFEDPGPTFRKHSLSPSPHTSSPPPASRDQDPADFHRARGLPWKDGTDSTVPLQDPGDGGYDGAGFLRGRTFGESIRDLLLPAGSPPADSHCFAASGSSVCRRPLLQTAPFVHSNLEGLRVFSPTFATSRVDSGTKTSLFTDVLEEPLSASRSARYSDTETTSSAAESSPWPHSKTSVGRESRPTTLFQRPWYFTQQHTRGGGPQSHARPRHDSRTSFVGAFVARSASRRPSYHTLLPTVCRKATSGSEGNGVAEETPSQEGCARSSLSFFPHTDGRSGLSLLRRRHDSGRGLEEKALQADAGGPGKKVWEAEGLSRKQGERQGGGEAKKRKARRPRQALGKSRSRKPTRGTSVGPVVVSTEGETVLLSGEGDEDVHTHSLPRPLLPTSSFPRRSVVFDSASFANISSRHHQGSTSRSSLLSPSSAVFSLSEAFPGSEQGDSAHRKSGPGGGQPPIPAKFRFSTYPPALRISPSPSLMPELSPWWHRVVHFFIAFVCLSLFLASALLQCLYRGTAVRQRRDGHAKGTHEGNTISSQPSSFSLPQPFSLMCILACCVVSLLDIVVAALLWPAVEDQVGAGQSGGGDRAPGLARSRFFFYKPYVASRLARPLLLGLFCYPVLRMLVRIVRTLPKVKTIILATFLSVLLFDWLGVILFAGTSGHDEFRSFQSGCTSLLLVVTTVRLPQVLLRGYTVHEVAVLFIVVFYLLTAVLLGLFAAAFYTGYRDGDLQDRREQQELSRRYVDTAFELLALYQKRLDACLPAYSPNHELHNDTRWRDVFPTACPCSRSDAQAGNDVRSAEVAPVDQVGTVTSFDSVCDRQPIHAAKVPGLLPGDVAKTTNSKDFSVVYTSGSGQQEADVSLGAWYAFYRHFAQLPGRPQFGLSDPAGDVPPGVSLVSRESPKQAPPACEPLVEKQELRGKRKAAGGDKGEEDGFDGDSEVAERPAGLGPGTHNCTQLREADCGTPEWSDGRHTNPAWDGDRSLNVLEDVGGPRVGGITRGMPATTGPSQRGAARPTPFCVSFEAESQHGCFRCETERSGKSLLISSGIDAAAGTGGCGGVSSSDNSSTARLKGLSSSQPPKSPTADGRLPSLFFHEGTSIYCTSIARTGVVEDDACSNSDSGRSDLPWWQAFWGQRYRRANARSSTARCSGSRARDGSTVHTSFPSTDRFSRYEENVARVGGRTLISPDEVAKPISTTRANLFPALYPLENGEQLFKLRLRGSPSFKQWSSISEDALELFSLLTRGDKGGKRIAKTQFQEVVSTLAAYDTGKQKEEERAWRSDSCHSAIRRRLLNAVADVCVVASLVLTYMQTRKFINKASNLTGEVIESSPIDLAEGMPASCFGSVAGAYWLQNALSFVYLASVVVRIRLTTSMKRYTGLSLRERFDICIGVGVMVLELACLWAGSASAFHPACTTETFDDLSRCLAFIRVLRGIRIFFRISPLRKLIFSLVAAVAALNTVLLVLVVIFCAYGTVGMELFGGIIKCDMDHLPPKGPDMGDPTDWGVLNFNDFFASLVTLFLLTVNGWDDSLKALIKHTSVFSCGAYFVSFYILTDTIILNLLVALVLEAYDQVGQRPDLEGHKRRSPRWSGS